MADCFNLLSGATVDSRQALLFELMRSGLCYAGFARNLETWGQLCLIKYKPVSGQTWPTDIVGGQAGTGGFMDQYHVRLEGTDSNLNTCFVGSYEVQPGDTLPPDPNNLDYEVNPHAPAEQNPEVIFINSEWIMLKYINPERIWPLTASNGNEIKYYIVDQNKDAANMLEIEKVDEYRYPGLDVPVRLKYTAANTLNPNEADFVPISTPLMRRLNIQGEYIITGATDEFITWFRDSNASTFNYFLTDGSIQPIGNGTDATGGSLLLNGIRFEEMIETAEETALIFSYTVTASDELGNEYQIRPRFKITTLGNINNRLALFHESLPVWQHVSPVSDGNPPGLPVGYLRHPVFNKSIFDIKGIRKIEYDDVWFVKEIRDAELAFWQTEVADNTGNLDLSLAIEEIQIDIDSVTQLAVYQRYIKTKSLTYGLKHSFSNVMYDKILAHDDPTGEIYRQFFISFAPQIVSGSDFTTASAISYGTPGDLFNKDQHESNMGIVLYVANKIPVYRNFIGDSGEKFKIII